MTPPLVIERLVAAPPERVWSLWSTAGGLAEWWWTFLDGTTDEVDIRVGGGYRIDDPTAGIGGRGEFLSVEPEQRFTATWVWVEDGTDGDLEQIDVRFEGDPGGTRLTIRHTGPWASPTPAEAYAQGWHDTLARLDALVG